jgi:cytidylate kinase
MVTTPRSMRSKDKIIEDQITKWQSTQKRKYKKPIRPVITISRLPGAGGKILARQLAEELKIDHFDQEIIEEIAKNASVSTRVVATLDEQDRSIWDEWIRALDKRNIWPYEYIGQLTKAVCTIGAHGHAVILGRGASYILPPEICLRVLVIAPLEFRLNKVQKEFKATEKEAKQRVMKTESERRGFIRRYFHADMTDPVNYDIVINTMNIAIDSAVNILREAYNSRHWYDYSVQK